MTCDLRETQSLTPLLSTLPIRESVMRYKVPGHMCLLRQANKGRMCTESHDRLTLVRRANITSSATTIES